MTDTLLSTPVVLLAVSCTLMVLRLVLVIWKHLRKPLLEDTSPEDMSPMEIANRQKKIYMWECWSFVTICFGFDVRRWRGFIIYVAVNTCFSFL